MYLIAGLGNPSRTYEGTRHNIGFTMIDAIGNKFGIDVTTKKHKALVGRGIIDGMRAVSYTHLDVYKRQHNRQGNKNSSCSKT